MKKGCGHFLNPKLKKLYKQAWLTYALLVQLHERDNDAKSEAKQNNAPEATPAGSAEAAPKDSMLDKVKGAFHRQARRAERGF